MNMRDGVMNMRDLCHEYEGLVHEYGGGCILREFFFGKVIGVDLNYLFTSPLFEAHMGSRH